MSDFIHRHARFFIAAALFSLVTNLALLTPSLYMLQVYDRVLSTRSVETLVMLSLIVGAALLLMFVLDLLRSRLLTLAGSLFEATVGARALRSLLDAGGSAAAAAQANALRDVGVLRGFLAGPGIVSLFDAPWMLIYIAVVFLFSVTLGWLALASAAVLVVLAWCNERATRQRLELAQQQSRDVARFIDTVLRHADVVKALGMAPAVGSRWRQMTTEVQSTQLATQRVAGPIGAATKCFRQSVQVAMLAAAAWLVIEQQATPGVMVAVTVILGRALAPVESLIGQWKLLVEARAAWRRIDALVGASEAGRFAGLPEPSGAVTIENIVYAPPGATRAVLRNLSVEIAAGEVLAVVGPSGSGKSTLARLMLGILPANSGAIRLDGADLSQWDPARLGPYVGYLPQDVALFSGTVAENIARLGSVDDAAVVDAAQRAHVHELIVRLPRGYDTPVGEGGRFLSGGQRQRVALARALYGRPKIVVLDEPNANLDNEGEQALARAIAEMRSSGTTVVLITQRTQILSVADRILMMRDGSVERIGVRQDKAGGGAGAGSGGAAPGPGADAEGAHAGNPVVAAASVPVLHQAR